MKNIQVTVDEFWWNQLSEHLKFLHDNRSQMSAFGVLMQVGNVEIAAKAVMDGAMIFVVATGDHQPVLALDAGGAGGEGKP